MGFYEGFSATLQLGDVEMRGAKVRWSHGFEAPVVVFGDLSIVGEGSDMPAMLRRLADEVEAVLPASEVA